MSHRGADDAIEENGHCGPRVAWDPWEDPTKNFWDPWEDPTALRRMHAERQKRTADAEAAAAVAAQWAPSDEYGYPARRLARQAKAMLARLLDVVDPRSDPDQIEQWLDDDPTLADLFAGSDDGTAGDDAVGDDAAVDKDPARTADEAAGINSLCDHESVGLGTASSAS